MDRVPVEISGEQKGKLCYHLFVAPVEMDLSLALKRRVLSIQRPTLILYGRKIDYLLIRVGRYYQVAKKTRIRTRKKTKQLESHYGHSKQCRT